MSGRRRVVEPWRGLPGAPLTANLAKVTPPAATGKRPRMNPRHTITCMIVRCSNFCRESLEQMRQTRPQFGLGLSYLQQDSLESISVEPSWLDSATRWSTTLPSKVNLPHANNFRITCGHVTLGYPRQRNPHHARPYVPSIKSHF